MVEFNARFGDPETQVVLDRLASPLAPLLAAAAAGDLAGAAPLEWHPGAAVVVVIAAEGYPEAPVKGDEITGTERPGQDRRLPAARGHRAGRRGALVSAGGRVLNAVGSGPDVAAARARAYELAGTVSMRGGWYRRDIAARRSDVAAEGGDAAAAGQHPRAVLRPGLRLRHHPADRDPGAR